MKRLLAASDLSERSDRAVQRAVRLAARLGAECHVLTVLDEALPADLAGDLRARAEERLVRQVEALGGGPAKVSVVTGDPAAAIPAEALRIGADLLVIGLHRPRPFLDALRETTMERLVRLSDVPVLLVRRPAAADYGSVLALVSFSRACTAAVRAAGAIAPGAAVEALHAVHVPFAGLTGDGTASGMAQTLREEAAAEAEAWTAGLGEAGRGLAVSLVSQTVTGAMEERLREKDYDLVAIGGHTRTGGFLHGLGNFASRLIRNPPTDLLVAKR